MLAIILTIAGLDIAADVPVANPLVRSGDGWVQCYDPDDQKRTCRSLASYSATGPSHYDNTAEVLISKSPLITMETTTPVEIVNGAVCGAINVDSIMRGKIRSAGKRLSEDKSRPVREIVAGAMAPFTGKMICTSYVADGNILKAIVTIDGQSRSDMSQRVEWIKADAGYTVSP